MSGKSTYLPTMAILTSCCGFRIRSHELVPRLEARRRRPDAELLADAVVDALDVELVGQLVDVIDVLDGDHVGLGEVAEERDLLLEATGHGLVAAREEQVGLDAVAEQLLDGVLRGLGLELARGRHVHDQREVDEEHVLFAHVVLELTDGLEEGQRLDVAHGAADLDDRDVGRLGAAVDPALDLVGDVRDDLHGAAQVLSVALVIEDGLVDPPGGEVVRLAHAWPR